MSEINEIIKNAILLYQRQEFVSAIPLLKHGSANGNSQCSYYLANYYLLENGFEYHPPSAFPLLFQLSTKNFDNSTSLFIDCLFKCCDFHECADGNFSLYDFFEKNGNSQDLVFQVLIRFITKRHDSYSYFFMAVVCFLVVELKRIYLKLFLFSNFLLMQVSRVVCIFMVIVYLMGMELQ
jgi:hypothetical protein